MQLVCRWTTADRTKQHLVNCCWPNWSKFSFSGLLTGESWAISLRPIALNHWSYWLLVFYGVYPSLYGIKQRFWLNSGILSCHWLNNIVVHMAFNAHKAMLYIGWKTGTFFKSTAHQIQWLPIQRRFACKVHQRLNKPKHRCETDWNCWLGYKSAHISKRRNANYPIRYTSATRYSAHGQHKQLQCDWKMSQSLHITFDRNGIFSGE